MSFFSKLFLGGKAAESVASTINESARATLSIIDESFDTDQEKREAKMQAMAVYADLIKTQTQESTGTAEARRWFLQVITNFVMTMAVCVIVAQVCGRNDIAQIIISVVKDFQLGWAFVSAVGFYFLTHVASAITGTAKK